MYSNKSVGHPRTNKHVYIYDLSYFYNIMIIPMFYFSCDYIQFLYFCKQTSFYSQNEKKVIESQLFLNIFDRNFNKDNVLHVYVLYNPLVHICALSCIRWNKFDTGKVSYLGTRPIQSGPPPLGYYQFDQWSALIEYKKAVPQRRNWSPPHFPREFSLRSENSGRIWTR